MMMTMMTNLGIWIDAKEEEKGMYVFCCFACVVGINEHEQGVKREKERRDLLN